MLLPLLFLIPCGFEIRALAFKAHCRTGCFLRAAIKIFDAKTKSVKVLGAVPNCNTLVAAEEADPAKPFSKCNGENCKLEKKKVKKLRKAEW